MEAIDMLLNDLESEILRAKKATFSSTDIIVNRKTMLDLVARIRVNLPQILQDAARINRDEADIISRAQAYAQTTVENAKAEAQNAADASEVARLADQRAKEIVDSAQADYNDIVSKARSYSYELLSNTESYLQHLLAVLHSSMDSLK